MNNIKPISVGTQRKKSVLKFLFSLAAAIAMVFILATWVYRFAGICYFPPLLRYWFVVYRSNSGFCCRSFYHCLPGIYAWQ